MADELLTIGVGLDTSDVKSGLEDLGKTATRVSHNMEESLTDASKGVQKIENAAESAAQRLRRLDDAADDLSERSGKTATAMGMIGGVLGRINPQLEEGTRLIADLADAVDVASMFGSKWLKVLGPIGIALGVAGTAYAVYRRQTEAAAEAQRLAEERAKALAEALQGVANVTQNVQAQIQLMNGEIDQFGATAQTQADQVREASKAVTDSYDEQIRLSQDRINVLEMEANKTQTLLDMNRGTAVAARDAALALSVEQRNMQDLTEARDQETARMERQLEVIDLMADFRRESVAAQEAEREAARMAAEAQRAAAEAERERAERAREVASAVSELASIEREQAMAQMSDQEKINFLLDEKIARIEELAQITGQDTTALQLEAELLARQEIAEVERTQHEERLKRQEELSALRLAEHEAAMAEMKEEQAARMDTFSEIGEAYGNLAQLAEMAAQKQATASEEAARKTAALAKRLGLFQIAIDTAVGLQKAITANAGNPIAAAAAIAAVLTGSAVQTATVASQSLHSGGNLAPDEQSVRTVILRDEVVTSRGQALSPEETRSQSRGRAETVVIPAFQHFGQFFADVVEGGGTPLHDLIYEGRTLGRAGY